MAGDNLLAIPLFACLVALTSWIYKALVWVQPAFQQGRKEGDEDYPCGMKTIITG